MSLVSKLLIIGVIFLSIFLRFHNYTQYPQRGATSDEYTYSFLGVSLLTKGVPVSWSTFSAYPTVENITIRSIHFPLVSPYFDHPPLYGLLAGGWSLFFGQDTFEKIDLATLRVLPIILSTISGLLVFLIAYKLYGYRVGMLSLVLYSSITIFVMNQRISVSENFLTLLLLMGLYIFSSVQKITTKHLLILGVLAGLAFLTKIAGIFIFLSLLILLLITHSASPRHPGKRSRVRRDEAHPGSGFWTSQNDELKTVFSDYSKKVSVVIFCLSFLLVTSFLFVYAAVYNWNLFWAIQALQSGRNIGPQALFMLTMQPVIVNKIYYDGWYFLGLLSLLFLAIDYKKHTVVIIPAVIYFFFLLFSLTREGQSGWYMIPMFPFMAIALGLFVQNTLSQKSLLFFLLPLFVGLYLVQYAFESAFGLSPIAYRIIFGLLFLPLACAFLYKKGKYFSQIGYAMFYLFVLGTFLLTYSYIHPA